MVQSKPSERYLSSTIEDRELIEQAFQDEAIWRSTVEKMRQRNPASCADLLRIGATVTGWSEDPEKDLREAIRLFDKADVPVEAAWCRLDLALHLRAYSSGKERLLDEAYRVFEKAKDRDGMSSVLEARGSKEELIEDSDPTNGPALTMTGGAIFAMLSLAAMITWEGTLFDVWFAARLNIAKIAPPVIVKAGPLVGSLSSINSSLLPLASRTDDIPSLSLAFSKTRYASSNNRSFPELYALRCKAKSRRHQAASTGTSALSKSLIASRRSFSGSSDHPVTVAPILNKSAQDAGFLCLIFSTVERQMASSWNACSISSLSSIVLDKYLSDGLD
jgi:hypothetical protein